MRPNESTVELELEVGQFVTIGPYRITLLDSGELEATLQVEHADGRSNVVCPEIVPASLKSGLQTRRPR